MKNIILIDSALTYLNTMLSVPDVYIAVLVCDYNMGEEAKQLLYKYKSGIGKIYYRSPMDYEEFFLRNESTYNLTSEDIKLYENAQLKVTRALSRQALDNAEIEYRYLCSLRFWLGIFNEYKIDKVISLSIEHGDCYDSIPYEIAIKNNIGVFITECHFGNFENIAFCLKCLNDDKFLNIKHLLNKKTDYKNYVFNKSAMNMKKENLCEKFKKYYYWNIKLPINIIRHNLKRLFRSRKKNFLADTSVYQTVYTITDKIKYEKYKYIKELKKLYNTLSIIPNSNENYIFYPLHFEPEASILNRGKIRNQLFVIKMLSDNLPQGWKLYVKEHPYQFEINNPGLLYQFKFVEYFRSLQFYRQIKRMKNVELISLSKTSKELVKHSKAVATISGTIALETICENKPLMIFSDCTTVASLVNTTFLINSTRELNEAISKIEKEYTPNYDNLDIVFNEYIFEEKEDTVAKMVSNKDELMYNIFNYILNL